MTRFAMISMHTSPLDQPGVGDGGGMNVYVGRLASALARRGHEVDVYTRATSELAEATRRIEPGFTMHFIPAGPLAPVAKEELLDLVDEFADNVMARFGLYPELVPDVIHSNYYISGLIGHRLKHRLNRPMITTFHTIEKVKMKGRAVADDLLASEIRIQAEDEVAGCSDYILASCHQEASDIYEALGVEKSRIKVLPLGVDDAIFAPGSREMARVATDLPIQANIMLYVGRIQPLKGLSLAFESFRELAKNDPSLHLVVVGGPSGHLGHSELEKCVKVAMESGISERVILRDAVPQYELASYYRAADVLVVPSRTESFGLVALEAMSCGTPVVASCVGGLKSLVVDGVTGILVAERHPSSFARAVGIFLRNPATKRSFGANGHSRSKNFSWRSSARIAEKISIELANSRLMKCS
ncbi:MAG: glycosyltransferase [Actinomycetota bacterium]|nr:glycosyltransferase [Actinomycetota bacterium]